TNNTPATDDTPAVADATPPVISTTTVNGNRMVITYTEANSLDGTALTGDAGFRSGAPGAQTSPSPAPWWMRRPRPSPSRSAAPWPAARS
ncbi:SwmB domain-containing protein, partial [Verminephrobacter aporrectodeae]|uniref:SwmB domain-containing protein n=1 Tax=Verminephrobacter aporrectodeae TaxID=1110389 RepID=UPI00191C6D5A